MDRYVRGLDNGVDREPAVRAFVMGENAWREADRWPLPGTVRRTLVLDGEPGPRRAAGASPGREKAAFNPAATRSCPIPRSRSTTRTPPTAGAHDYRQLADGRTW